MFEHVALPRFHAFYIPPDEELKQTCAAAK